MELLLHDIIDLLIAVGPWVVFAVALIETAAFVGLLVPAEATVVVAAILADRGIFSAEAILAAAFFGGLAGDQIGYLLGRHGGGRIAGNGGRIGRIWKRYELTAADLFRRHSALAVTVARFLSFVRTLMPWFAGMSRMRYPRFLLYDALGVLGWAVGSVALGYIAGESWRVVTGAVGTVSAVVVGLVALAGILVAVRRRRAARPGAARPSPADPPAPPGDAQLRADPGADTRAAAMPPGAVASRASAPDPLPDGGA